MSLVPTPRSLVHSAMGLTLVTTLAGCGHLPLPEPREGGISSAALAPRQAASPTAGAAGPPTSAQAGPPPFEAVIKGAERQAGLLPLWRRQEKVWIELAPEQFGQPLYLSPRLVTGIGEGGLLGGLMHSRWAQVGRPQWIEFRKVHQQVQVLALNSAYTAAAGSPQARAVQVAYSPSLLAALPLASAPGKDGAVLVEANPLWLSDVLGLGMHLQRHYKQGYAFDPRASHIVDTRTGPEGTLFTVNQHYASPSIAVAGAGVPLGTLPPSVPATLPDPRSLFVQVQFGLSALPATPFKPRAADARVGYFTTTRLDFSDDLARTPRKTFINRWRLEKQQAGAAMSAPVKPIVFWLDASIPEAHRPAIREGVLAWNRAFEAIGIQGAIEVRQAEDGVDAATLPGASIRWMTNAQASFGAIGPTHVDPRTGEILDADIALESLSVRAMRQLRATLMPDLRLPMVGTGSPMGPANPPTDAPAAECAHADALADQLSLALAAQGLGTDMQGLDPDAPEVREFVQAYLRETTLHEVGHALGLRHNFRASRWRTQAELDDPVLTAREGHSASVMDYSPVNLPAPGQRGGAPFMASPGPYDLWAIAYGYGDLPEDEIEARKALRALAARSAEPAWADALAYGTDEDAATGLDPQAMPFDLGRDPVAFARRRLALAQHLIERAAHLPQTPQAEASQPRRHVAQALREAQRAAEVLVRQIAGMVVRRDAPGSGRDPLDPLPSQLQREALNTLSETLLTPWALRLPPELMRRLVPDFRDGAHAPEAVMPGELSLAEQRLALQRALMTHLTSEALATRLMDQQAATRDREAKPLLAAELHQRVREATWASTRGLPADVAATRRDLQRAHVLRLAEQVLRPASPRADVRALSLAEARSLLLELQRRLPRVAPQGPTHAHLLACIETLREALRAQVVRATP